MTPDVEKTIQLKASQERVWRAITEADELSAWFPDTIKWDGLIGSEGWFGWENHGRYAVRIEAFEPPSRISWRWARTPDKPLAECDTTLVEWTLTPRDDGGTMLYLRESGFKTEELRQGNDTGWDEELAEMLIHLGEPDTAIA